MKFAAALLLFYLSISASSADLDSVQWTKLSEKNGIQVFEKSTPGSNVITLRGECLIDAPITKVANVVFDPARAKEWVDHLEETKIPLWFSETEFLEYDHIGTPMILKDRDFLSHVTMVFDTEKKQMEFTYKNATDAESPEEFKPKGRFVRGELSGTKYILRVMPDGKSTYLIGEIFTDPKGAIPKWLVNMFQREWPYRSLMALRRQVAKTDIQDIPKITQLVRERLQLSKDQ